MAAITAVWFSSPAVEAETLQREQWAIPANSMNWPVSTSAPAVTPAATADRSGAGLSSRSGAPKSAEPPASAEARCSPRASSAAAVALSKRSGAEGNHGSDDSEPESLLMAQAFSRNTGQSGIIQRINPGSPMSQLQLPPTWEEKNCGTLQRGAVALRRHGNGTTTDKNCYNPVPSELE